MNLNSQILCTIIYDLKKNMVNKNQVGRIEVAYFTTKSCSNVTGRMNIALKRNLSRTTIMMITIMINAI
jgi:hypothetical protein